MPPKKRQAPEEAAALAAGAPAVAPVVRAKRPKRELPAPALAAASRAPPQSERLNVHTKAALAASRREVFDAYHTVVLWAWGSDHAGWAIPRTDIGNRERILATLSSDPGVVMPAGKADMDKCWRRIMQPGKSARFPLREHEQASQREGPESQSEEDESDVATDPRDEELRRLREALAASESRQPAAANSRSAPAMQPPLSAPGSLAASAGAGAQTQHTTCGLCYAVQVVLDPTNYRCSACGQIPHLGFAHEQNVYWRQHAARMAVVPGTASSSGQSSHTHASSAASALHGTGAKRDREFERLATERAQLQHFASTAPITVAAALRISRQSYGAGEYTQTPAALLKLVQSGSLMKAGHALPRTLAAANTQTDHADTVIVMQNGRMTAADSVSAPPLQSLRDFCLALTSTILPALTEQPTAVADWLALARTIIELDARHGWAAANAYLEMLLSDRVHRDAPFADYDRNFVDSATRPRNTTSAGPPSGAGQHAHATYSTTSAAGGAAGTASWVKGACRDFNTSECQRGAQHCRFQHECPWPACSGADRKHPAFQCPAKPAGWRPQPRGGASAAPTRGGRAGGRGSKGAGASTVASAAAP